MGALPKRKLSKARRDRRRSQDKLEKPALSVCPKCKKMRMSHFKCKYCGYYGEEVKVEKKTSAASKEAKSE